MDYPLENLGPERFQLLCQSLITREYPRVQCLPVAQPDGGRDALSYLIESDKFIVFQVKYARKPLAGTDAHNWLVSILEDELPKVLKLIPRGASQYILVTNIPGTAHLDGGSIDRMNREMSDKLGIPSQCWWRDDLNRRLDNAWSLKWVYPELMTGPDFLRWIVESGLSEHRERRASSIRAFLRTQYDMDEEVRFKQVELQNKLLDLFIDVPTTFRDQLVSSRPLQIFYSRLSGSPVGYSETGSQAESVAEEWATESPHWAPEQENVFEASTLLLSEALQSSVPRIVMEGAPGQGKSTIAQYVCQVHRMRLLQEEDVLGSVPAKHKDVPVRLPIKVDLRDLATWIAKKDPFNMDTQNEPPKSWHKSLEGFLAALISHQSGGTQFSIDDFLAVSRISAILLVLDGLDEVADVQRRQDTVEEIVKGVQRLEENAASLQVIVTSRPAAFANSPGMPHTKYTYLQLLSLTRPLIMQYAEKWLRARRLDIKQAVEFRAVLKGKLDQPHLRDLARNPMQLAILLSLVLTRGASLPDKRTALYDYYIDLFFSREAEKSPTVREHRELLIDIHQFLAWLLHSEAELGEARASITQERLQSVVAEYLSRERHDPQLAKELFTGMVERVVALVSRVVGTFEFEVQPLREYFAACYLYFTAPQSSPGKEKSGSKPDRFDAIARNFYWLNVARFYAGCYSKGELPSLVERLQELSSEDGFRLISHPRTLAATLLADWVFTQNPKSVQQIVELAATGPGIRYLAQTISRRQRAQVATAIVLPPKCGKDELLNRCFELLNTAPPDDLEEDIAQVLTSNAESPAELATKWLDYFKGKEDPDDRARWLEYALDLEVLPTFDRETLQRLVGDLASDAWILGILYRARRLDLLEGSEELFDRTVHGFLERRITAQPQKSLESALDALTLSLYPLRYALAFRQKQAPMPLEALLERQRWSKLSWDPQITTATESYKNHRHCIELARVVEKESKRPAIEWATEIAPWESVIEAGRSMWGEQWAFMLLADVAAGIRSTAERCSECPDLLDHSRPLARRARYARLRSGAHSWWTKQFDTANTPMDRLLVCLLASTWVTTNTLIEIVDVLERNLATFDGQQWHLLFYAARAASSWGRAREEKSERLELNELPTDLSIRAASIFATRVDHVSTQMLYRKYMQSWDSGGRAGAELGAEVALDLPRFATDSWDPDLQLLQRCYQLGQTSEPRAFYVPPVTRESKSIPIHIAKAILNESEKYPAFLVMLCEERCRLDVARGVTPVAHVATRDNWFTSL